MSWDNLVCPSCRRGPFKNQRGLKIHMTKMGCGMAIHPSTPSDKHMAQSSSANASILSMKAGASASQLTSIPSDVHQTAYPLLQETFCSNCNRGPFKGDKGLAAHVRQGGCNIREIRPPVDSRNSDCSPPALSTGPAETMSSIYGNRICNGGSGIAALLGQSGCDNSPLDPFSLPTQAPNPAETICGTCGKGPFKGGRGLAVHMRQSGCGSSPEYLFRLPTQVPSPTETMCGMCGNGPFKGSRGLAAHMRQTGCRLVQEGQKTAASSSENLMFESPNSGLSFPQSIDAPMEVTYCQTCGRGPFKGDRGLAAHLRQSGCDSSPSDPFSPPTQATKPTEAMCGTCGRGPFKGDRGLAAHIGQTGCDSSPLASSSPLIQAPKHTETMCGMYRNKSFKGLAAHMRQSGCQVVQDGPKAGLSFTQSADAPLQDTYCQMCGRGPFKGDRGLAAHIGQSGCDSSLPDPFSPPTQCPNPTETMCGMCGKGPFKGDRGLAAHLRQSGCDSSPLEPFSSPTQAPNPADTMCIRCGKGPFKGDKGLTAHLRQSGCDSSPLEPFSSPTQSPNPADTMCGTCGKGPFKGDRGLAAHLRQSGCDSSPLELFSSPIQVPNPLEKMCGVCGKGPFKGEIGLAVHVRQTSCIRIKESLPGPKSMDTICNTCGKGPFKDDKELAAHIRRTACSSDHSGFTRETSNLIPAERHIVVKTPASSCPLTKGKGPDDLRVKLDREGKLIDLTKDDLMAAPSTRFRNQELQKKLKDITINKSDRDAIGKDFQHIKEAIIEHINEHDENFRWKPYHSGSSYEYLKIIEADEFDCLMVPDIDGLVTTFDEVPSTVPKFYCNLRLTHNTRSHPGRLFLGNGQYLSPKKFREYFSDLVSKALKDKSSPNLMKIRKTWKIEYTPDILSPAVTLKIKNIKTGKNFDCDLVPAIRMAGWPKPARKWRSNWLDDEAVSDVTEEYHVVPKIHWKEFETKQEECILWRLSFSCPEKKILRHADGLHKTDIESTTCRKSVIKLLKNDLKIIKARHANIIKYACSFHLKTTVLHIMNEGSLTDDEFWEIGEIDGQSNLRDRYLDALRYYIKALNKVHLDYFFIPGENLMDDVKHWNLAENVILIKEFLNILKDCH